MSFPRTIAFSATVGLLALAVTACSPPNQNDSAIKIKTATGVAVPSKSTSSDHSESLAISDELPGYIDCVAAPKQLPTEISLDCVSDTDLLSNIVWESWDEDSAIGTATRVTTSTGTEISSDNIAVELSFPTETSQGLVFSQVSVDGEIIYL